MNANDITKKACTLRVLGFPLGNATSAITSTPSRPGAFQHFQNASIYWSLPTAAHVVYGDIGGKWASFGWENGLGFPTTDELGAPDGRGRYNHFEFGSVYWTPTTGAHEVHGSIRQIWAEYGWEKAGGPTGYEFQTTPTWAMGYPVTDEMGTPDGRGRFNYFENGAIYWNADAGAHRVYGRILAQWARDGWEATMGYPVNEPRMNGPNFCAGMAQRFVRFDGTGGWYCEQQGWTEYRADMPSMPGNAIPGSVVISSSGGSKPTSGPVQPTAPMNTSGAWICANSGIPSKMVVTQYNTQGCLPVGSMFVQPPANDLWVCSWASDALVGFVRDRTEPNAPQCNNGARHHIVKL